MTKTFVGNLKLTIVDAKDLKAENFGKDPYCNVSLGTAGLGGILDGQGIGKERFKTKTHENGGRHPVWNESHLFDLQGMKPEVRLKIALYDHDLFKDDYLGLAEITLKELMKNKDTTHYYELQEKGKEYRVIGYIGLIANFDCKQIPDSISEEMAKNQTTKDEIKQQGQMPQHLNNPDEIQQKGQMQAQDHEQQLIQGQNQPRMSVSEPCDKPQHRRSNAIDFDQEKREPRHTRLHLAGDIDRDEDFLKRLQIQKQENMKNQTQGQETIDQENIWQMHQGQGH